MLVVIELLGIALDGFGPAEEIADTVPAVLLVGDSIIVAYRRAALLSRTQKAFLLRTDRLEEAALQKMHADT